MASPARINSADSLSPRIRGPNADGETSLTLDLLKICPKLTGPDAAYRVGAAGDCPAVALRVSIQPTRNHGEREMALRVRQHDSILDVDPAAWNALAADSPFLRHEFLSALEVAGCVGPETAWRPAYLTASEDSGRLAGALPLYIKYDSRGEFVFDWSWAAAYERAGLSYYPKLVSAVPFTPATGRRLLVNGGENSESVAAELLVAARTLGADIRASSLHVLFPTDVERQFLGDEGLMARKSCQFHWHNDGYASFEDFLGRFTSMKRKKVRRERRRIAEADVTFEHLRGDEPGDEDWDAIYEYYAHTFLRRGRAPYLNREFFGEIARTMPENLVIVLARFGKRPIATAICFRSHNTLYGRYWGSLADFHSLHFEACYYQGIDYCIREGLSRFEPGTQGEHKLSRGFTPTATWSSHWIANPGFAQAIGKFLHQERDHVDAYMRELATHTPYRKDRPEPGPARAAAVLRQGSL